jgi:hemerythrin superfamily protein
MDAIELLKKDHQKVKELFQRFNGGGGLTGMVKRVTGNVPERQRRQAADRICRELDAHAHIEEEIFYHGVRALDDDQLNGMLAEAFKEHATVKRQVSTIRNAIGRDHDLQAKMDELQSCVDHHVREEEGEMFPRVELLMDAPRREELASEMQARKQDLEARPSARASRAATTRGKTAKARSSRRRRTVGGTTRRTKQARARTTARARTRKRAKTAARGRARSRRAR